MAENIDNVIRSLDDLNKKAIASPIAFKGLTKSLITMADNTAGAGKSWTTFSRLVSGTPIWKYQNKLRGFLEVLAGFETRSQENIKALSEESSRVIETLQGFKSATESINELNTARESHLKRLEKEKEVEEARLKLNDNLEKVRKLENKGILNLSAKKRKLLSDLKQENSVRAKGITTLTKQAAALKKKASLSEDMKKTIQNSEIYQKVLAATGSEEKARLATTLFLNKKYKQQEKSVEKVKKNIKIAYAFDKKRVKEAKEIAKMQGKGIFGRFVAGRKEKKQQKKDQKAAVKGARKDSTVAMFGGLKEDFKSIGKFSKFLFPIPMLFKLVKGAMIFTKEGRQFRTKIYKIIPTIMNVMNALFRYLIIGMMAILGFFILMKYIKNLYDILKEMGILDEIKSSLMILFEAVKNIFKAFTSLLSGDYEQAFDYLKAGLDKTIQGALKLGKALLKAGFLALVAGFETVVNAVYSYLSNPDVRAKVNGIIMKAGMLIAGFIVVKLLVAFALQLAATFALPILLGVVVLAALFTVARFLTKNFGDKFQPTIDAIWNIFDTIKTFYGIVKDKIVDGIVRIFTWLNNLNLGDKLNTAMTKLSSYILSEGQKIIFKIPSLIGKAVSEAINIGNKAKEIGGKIKNFVGLANGGSVSSGGVFEVGESGRELVNLPKGAKVHSNSQSNQMLEPKLNNTFNITINARDTSDAELRRIADKIGNMVNLKINRSVSSRTLG